MKTFLKWVAIVVGFCIGLILAPIIGRAMFFESAPDLLVVVISEIFYFIFCYSIYADDKARSIETESPVEPDAIQEVTIVDKTPLQEVEVEGFEDETKRRMTNLEQHVIQNQRRLRKLEDSVSLLKEEQKSLARKLMGRIESGSATQIKSAREELEDKNREIKLARDIIAKLKI
ncbi:MAG: hypothetical protein AB8F78_05190 [Saprospiraceae bacterium]